MRKFPLILLFLVILLCLSQSFAHASHEKGLCVHPKASPGTLPTLSTDRDGEDDAKPAFAVIGFEHFIIDIHKAPTAYIKIPVHVNISLAFEAQTFINAP